MANRNPHSPLTDAHLNQMKGLEPIIEKTEAQIALAKAAGINVDAQEKHLQDLKGKLTTLRRVYFPGE